VINRDSLAALLLLAVAGLYYQATLAIPSSSLSDAVGADGLPKLLTAALALVALALVVKGALAARRAAPVVSAADAGEERATPLRALGFIAIGVGYMIVAPWTGYLVAVALLIVAVAVYEGERPSLKLTAIAAAGGVGFWLVFVKLLGVEQPMSRLLG
jgi:putative tricarboxylic transport membrane protein